MSSDLTPEQGRRLLSQLEISLFHEVTGDSPPHMTTPTAFTVDKRFLDYCSLIDSWKSVWLSMGVPYPVPVGPGGVRETEYLLVLGLRENIKTYLRLRAQYPQQSTLPEEIVGYADSVLKRIDESLSNLDDWQNRRNAIIAEAVTAP